MIIDNHPDLAAMTNQNTNLKEEIKRLHTSVAHQNSTKLDNAKKHELHNIFKELNSQRNAGIYLNLLLIK